MSEETKTAQEQIRELRMKLVEAVNRESELFHVSAKYDSVKAVRSGKDEDIQSARRTLAMSDQRSEMGESIKKSLSEYFAQEDRLRNQELEAAK